MRKKTIGWVFVSSAILIAAAIFGSARLVHAESPTTFDRLATSPAQVLEQEPALSHHTESETEVANAPIALQSPSIVLVQASTMPSHVYIFNNRETVTELPLIQGGADSLSSGEDDAASQGVVSVRVSVAPLRLIVIDNTDTITEIWSNTTGSKRDYYSLRVKEGSKQGADHPLTQGIVAQYNHLGKDIDWQEKGQVYGFVE